MDVRECVRELCVCVHASACVRASMRACVRTHTFSYA